MHVHSEPTRQAPPTIMNPNQDHATDHGGGRSHFWMALCCAPMVLFLVAIALGWFAIR